MKETDMRGTFLQLALNTAYDEKSTDLLTGLRAQTKPGTHRIINYNIYMCVVYGLPENHQIHRIVSFMRPEPTNFNLRDVNTS